MQIRSDRIRSDFGTKVFISDWIGLIKLFHSRRIGSDFDIRNKIELIIYNNYHLVKYFHLNEKFILFNGLFRSDWNSLSKLGFGLDSIGWDWILNISLLSDYKRPIRSDAHLYSLYFRSSYISLQ